MEQSLNFRSDHKVQCNGHDVYTWVPNSYEGIWVHMAHGTYSIVLGLHAEKSLFAFYDCFDTKTIKA